MGSASEAISPWAETNQGLLSLLALGAALAIAVFEFIRAQNAERKREHDFVRLVVDLLDGLVVSLDDLASRRPTGASLLSDTVGDWNALIGKSYQVVEAIIPVAPPNARLALVMLDVREFLRFNEIAVGTPSAGLPLCIADLRAPITKLRARVREAVRRSD